MRLPLLEGRRPELETCAFCPKLSRAVCPVSNADGKETTTPWGKMSAAYLLSRGAVATTREQAWPPWACTGCFACRKRCELDNDVAGTLLDARADLMAAGVAPDEAVQAAARHDARVQESDRALAEASARAKERGARIEPYATTRVLVGCLTARAHADAAADAIVATSHLAGAVDVVRGCCGAPLRAAGARDRFIASARAVADAVASAKRLVIADAGCAHTIVARYAEVGVAIAPRAMHFVELVAEHLPRLARVELGDRVRIHDSCHLGRGLGLYDPPRAILGAILGRAPDEFVHRRDEAVCSGGGGLLPVTARDTARTIAERRAREHEEQGGGAVVTTCASSKKQLERAGARVVDLVTLVARALAPEGDSPGPQAADSGGKT